MILAVFAVIEMDIARSANRSLLDWLCVGNLQVTFSYRFGDSWGELGAMISGNRGKPSFVDLCGMLLAQTKPRLR